MPASGWAYNADGTAIHLLPQGTRFVQGDIYEFSYTAKDPTVNGLGFAAVRDFNAFLRYEKADESGTANPLAGDITRIYTEVPSQPGRMLNDFRTLGFNQAENGKKVFDGMMQWIAAGDGINMNYRFSQPGRTERNRQDQLYAEGVFPFANAATTDPITGKTAGRYDACTETNTCPLAMEIYSANEYWVKARVAAPHRSDGQDGPAGSPVWRGIYFISSHQHGTGNANAKGACQQFRTRSTRRRCSARCSSRWTSGPRRARRRRPATVPRLRRRHARAAAAAAGPGFPKIPGVTYTGLKTTRYLFNYGPRLLRDRHSDDQSAGRSRRPCIRTIRRTARSIRASCRRPTATATTSPACGCPT